MLDNPFLDDGPGDINRLADVGGIAAILQQAARERRDISYSEMLLMLGYRFTRPKMRALCKTLDAVDTKAAQRGQPALACLVVREGDRLPGQGWWISRHDYGGAWEGSEARRYLTQHQQQAYDYWGSR